MGRTEAPQNVSVVPPWKDILNKNNFVDFRILIGDLPACWPLSSFTLLGSSGLALLSPHSSKLYGSHPPAGAIILQILFLLINSLGNKQYLKALVLQPQRGSEAPGRLVERHCPGCLIQEVWDELENLHLQVPRWCQHCWCGDHTEDCSEDYYYRAYTSSWWCFKNQNCVLTSFFFFFSFFGFLVCLFVGLTVPWKNMMGSFWISCIPLF